MAWFIYIPQSYSLEVSGTDASKSRYREFSSGILDAVQRELLMMRLVAGPTQTERKCVY